MRRPARELAGHAGVLAARLVKLTQRNPNEVLVLVGLPACAIGLWQLSPRVFWAGVALLGALAAGWGVYRASRRP